MFPSKLLDIQQSPQPQAKTDEFMQARFWSIKQTYHGMNSDLSVKPYYSQQKEQMRLQLLEEANLDGDYIMTECNRLLLELDDSPSENQSPVKRNLEDLFSAIAIKDPQPYSELTHMNKFTGRLKFFDESKNYGFLVMDTDGSDIFVYANDLVKTGLPKDFLRTAKQGNLIRFQFTCMNYVGKYNQSRKAIDLEYIKPKLLPLGNHTLNQLLPYVGIQCTF